MMSMMPSAPPSFASNVDTILTLPKKTGALAIADECRRVALEFLNESQHWGKAELATWLMGSYSSLTQYASPYSRRRSGEYARPAPMLREIDVRMVERVIRSAREEVVAALTKTYEVEGGASFAFTMVAAGFVARCEDEGRVAGWVPTTDARRLADRVLSLLAADYLVRPDDYELDLGVCKQCNSVVFDAIARVRGTCHRHGNSMFVTRTKRTTLPYFPEGA